MEHRPSPDHRDSMGSAREGCGWWVGDDGAGPGRPGHTRRADGGRPAARPSREPAAWHRSRWRPTHLRAGRGCYGLQIDGAGFSEVLVVEFG